MREKHLSLHSCLLEIDEVDTARKRAATDYKDNLKKLKEERDELKRDISEEAETRSVQCREEPDMSLGKVNIVRGDTGATIETRTMTVDDRQVVLDVAPPPKVPKGKGKAAKGKDGA
jgi:hypothetical protein